MKDCLFRPHPVLLRIVALVVLTSGMMVGAWTLLASQTAQAAPPAQGQGPITILGITHTCTEAGLSEDPLNDTPDQAVLLQARQPQTHTLDSGGADDGGPSAGTHDKDWFTFSVGAGQAFTVSTTLPAGSILTTTEIALFTSSVSAQAGTNPAATTTSGDLGWVAAGSPATQTLWVRVVNPYAEAQDPSNYFCDVLYQIALRLGGSLDNAGTLKTAEGGAARTLTYTLVLSNAGEALSPVVVTDAFPAGVSVLTVTVSPSSVVSELITSPTGLTWTGSVTDFGSVELVINTIVDKGIKTSLVNTAWITANGSLIWRASGEVAVEEQPKVYLPIIILNQ
jgi:uncharacterized repeat protein (TIGR01451 family)